MVDAKYKSKIDKLQKLIDKFKSLNLNRIPDSFGLELVTENSRLWLPEEPYGVNLPEDYAYFLNTIGSLTIYRDGYPPLVFGPPVPFSELDIAFNGCEDVQDPRIQRLPELVTDMEIDQDTRISEWAASIGISDWLLGGVAGSPWTGLWGFSPEGDSYKTQAFYGLDPQTEEWQHEPVSFLTLLAESVIDLPEVKLLEMSEFTEEFFEFPDAALTVLEKNGDALRFLDRSLWDIKSVKAALANDGWAARFLLGSSFESRTFIKHAMKSLRDSGYVFPYDELQRNLIVGLLESIPDIGEEKVLNIFHRSIYESLPADLPTMSVD